MVSLGGLARSDAAGGFETEFASLAEEITQSHGGSQLTGSAARPEDGSASRDAAAVFDSPVSPGDGSAVDDGEPSANGGRPSARGDGESSANGNPLSSDIGGEPPGPRNDREPSLRHDQGE